MKKNHIKYNQSKSLWNYTLSPGWSPEEVEVLKKALQKFGIGRWRKIIKSECLPGKSIGQIYLQTQRLMGQQSLGDFMGLHVDIEKVFVDNSIKNNVLRKNKCIVNTGDNPNSEERKKKIEENRMKYGIAMDTVKGIKLPKRNKSKFKDVIMLEEILSDKFSTIEKLHYLGKLKDLVNYKLELIELLGQNYFKESKVVENKVKSGVYKVRKRVKKKSRRSKKGKYYDFSSEESDSINDSFDSNDKYDMYLDNIYYLNRKKKPAVVINLEKRSNHEYTVKEVVRNA